MNGRKVAVAIRSLVELGVCILTMQGCCIRHCLYPFCFMSDIMIWIGLGLVLCRWITLGLLGIRRMNRVPKGVDESVEG